MFASPAKTAEPIEKPFGVVTPPKNHLRPREEEAILGEKWRPIVK